MLHYEEREHPVELALGADACYYHPGAAQVPWNEECQPFGHQSVRSLFHAMTEAMAAAEAANAKGSRKEAAKQGSAFIPPPPFAPDTSGAAAVLYPLGMVIIVDAGGCAGNICGFDEPRWQEEGAKSAVFSAGLRDMDAIMGRDDKLIEKVRLA